VSTGVYISRVLPPLPIEALDGWRTQALCNGHPTEGPSTWDDSIHNENDRARAARVKRAQAICAVCPVAGPCGEDVDLRHDEGIRAGTDLRQLQKRRRRAS
jgi:hypothetical protein